MKILIIGEFSGVSKNLSLGFRSIGIESFVFSWGDGFKKIDQSSDSSYTIRLRNIHLFGIYLKPLSIFNRFIEARKLCRFLRYFSKKGKWDKIIIISPAFLKLSYEFWKPLFSMPMILPLVPQKSDIFLLCCGEDIIPNLYWGAKPESKLYVSLKKYNRNKSYGLKKFADYSRIISNVIPVTYTYAEAYRESEMGKSFTIFKTIPMPIDLSKLTPFNEIQEKIVVFHGINRPDEKGTPFIVAAMERLQTTYPDKVECVVEGKMPLNEYLLLMKRANVVIDQCYANSSGMNALYAMAMGKVVLGGNEPENIKEFNYAVPAINISANADEIFRKLELLVLNPSLIKELSLKSRRYVEEVHECKLIAKKYVDIFSESI